MQDLEAIARDLHLSVDTLKRPAELLRQGYEPAFLGTYRPDELGHIDTMLLFRLQRALEYRDRLHDYKDKLRQQGVAEGWWQDSLQEWIENAQSIAEVDGITRNVRSRKSSRLVALKDPRIAQLGQAILTYTGKQPDDLNAWVAQSVSVDLDAAPSLLANAKQWLETLLSEDASLLHRLGRQLLRKANVSVSVLADKPEKALDKSPEDSSVASVESVVTDLQDRTTGSEDAKLDSDTQDASNDEAYAVDSELLEPHDSSEEIAAEATSESELGKLAVDAEREQSIEDSLEASDTIATTAPTHDPISSFGSSDSKPGPLGKIVAKKLKTVTLRQLSPRQRRRRWLRGILQRYSKLKKPLHRLSHYQALMLGRGHRSQLIAVKLEYDRQSMVKIAREALCPGHHPLHHLLLEVADAAVNKLILPKLEQDIFAEVEESAHKELLEMAVRHLKYMIQQRPVRGHRILVIDASGTKTAAMAIVDPKGAVDFTGDLPSVSGRSDVVAQNVQALGELIHRYRVTLVAISNGNTRKFLMQTVTELMKQSGGSDLRWTIVDRTGADAYCETRQALRELPRISKRHRAAVWLGWRLQDPLIELTKIDPARLRLGSYQRELPQETLEAALLGAVSASVAARGIDVWNAHEKALVCLPGVNRELAREIITLRDSGELSTREKLVNSLKDKADATHLRQAIGYLRLFESTQTLDGTVIHPDDYRLAERLVGTGQLSMPAAAPEGWARPRLEKSSDATLTNANETTAPEEGASQSESNGIASQGDEQSLTDSDTVQSSTSELESASQALQEGSSDGSAADSIDSNSATQEGEFDVALSSVEVTEQANLDGSTNIEMASLANESTATGEVSESNRSETPPMQAVERSSVSPASPENPSGPSLPPPLNIDVEKLARSWQVGREKMKMVAKCLQLPFADTRDALEPIPLLSEVPSLATLKPGMTAWGVVVGVADFGAFVDLGPDCNGLIHVSRLSREYIDDPHEIVQMGDLMQVWVLSVDSEKKRVALSALPPGIEQAKRAPLNDSDESFSSGRGDRNRDFRSRSPHGEAARSGGGQGRDGKRPFSNQGGGRSSGSGERGGKPRFERNDRRGGGRGNKRESEGSSRTEGNRGEEVPKRSKPSAPAKPITDAMQQGLEPLRSFSDLLQFYQVKREDSAQSSTPKPATNAEHPVAEEAPAESEPNKA